MVAVELYRVMKQIERLEKKLESPDAGSQEKENIENELRNARVLKDQLDKMIDGAKGD
ncbi:conserved hypothetical protein [Syntrophobacter sp. SbD1]|nr:conserved hypothetical protein [Syntrophobacter sp. SbD1]